MNLSEITKFPILIISTPRSGSTVLAATIGEKYGLRVFLEPHISSYDEFVEYAKDNKDYVVKIHSRDIGKYSKSILQELFSDSSFKINIERRDRDRQIASAIIAHTRDVWAYTKNSHIEINNRIHFTENFIDLNINYFKKCYKATDDLHLNFDLVINYEDLGHITQSNYIKTPQPHNYEELLFAIRKKIENGS